MLKKVAAIFVAVVIASFIFVVPSSAAERRDDGARECYGSDCVAIRAKWHKQRDGDGLVITRVVARAVGDLETDRPHGVRYPKIELMNQFYHGPKYRPGTLGSDNVWKRHKNVRFGTRCAVIWFEGVLRRDNDNDESFIVSEAFCY